MTGQLFCEVLILNHSTTDLKNWEQMDDNNLVQRAQEGEREAFGELVRRHRSRMYGYARAITRESFLAEDIVQDALVKAFLHLGKLVEADKFLPWVHRIVRNQAFTRLKNTSARERAFSQLAPTLKSPGEESREWGDLDRILDRLGRTAAGKADAQLTPEEAYMQKETLEILTGIIGCLKPRERRIFESHFFDQLSPQEIAGLFELSSANVYQIISRSRKKVMQEKIRITVGSYMRTRKDMGDMKTVMVPDHESFTEAQSWTTAADALYAMLKAAGETLSHSMVMGLTGHAFRLNIVPSSVHIAGPTAYSFGDVLSRGLENIGYQSSYVDGMSGTLGTNANLLDPALLGKEAMRKRGINQALPEALDLIHRSLDRGIPVLAWDLFLPEFGLIYGYDDERHLLHAYECGKKDTLDYENLGRSVKEEIFVLALADSTGATFKQRLGRAMNMIVDHYDGRERDDCTGSVKGLAAYDAWIGAFRGGEIEPNGNAYNIAVVRDARIHAVRFLNEAAEQWPLAGETAPGSADVPVLAQKAAREYQEALEHFFVLRELFPFPQGGDPNESDASAKAVSLLELIKEREQTAVGYLRELSDLLR
ncbi:RNA polymerase sigma factor [Paenibacillus chitinolyticus]|uniref:RNA polymerase sigma factor n=1 Tax=Paenibacillus chitinolyticus TaxID=79263 RepID=UPI001C4711C4|nr:RNA polymerase sigma factor [Paenibacillus chitinolyticus]MBV6715286.1 RNA polymerase sigma factor [Paenibacillus chitinolyticus]